MKKLILTAMALLVAGLAAAQTPMMYEQEALQMLNSKMFSKKLDASASSYPSDFSKNTLAFSVWHYAKVEFKDGSDMDSLRINYDYNIDALVVQFNLDIAAISLVSDLVNGFEFSEEARLRKFVKIGQAQFTNGNHDMPFYELLAGGEDGEIALVKQFNKALMSKDMQVTYGGEVAEDKYEQSVYYYLRKKGESKYSQIALNKKKIIAAIGKSQGKAVQNYAKENGLKWKDEDDAARILSHFLN